MNHLIECRHCGAALRVWKGGEFDAAWLARPHRWGAHPGEEWRALPVLGGDAACNSTLFRITPLDFAETRGEPAGELEAKSARATQPQPELEESMRARKLSPDEVRAAGGVPEVAIDLDALTEDEQLSANSGTTVDAGDPVADAVCGALEDEPDPVGKLRQALHSVAVDYGARLSELERQANAVEQLRESQERLHEVLERVERQLGVELEEAANVAQGLAQRVSALEKRGSAANDWQAARHDVEAIHMKSIADLERGHEALRTQLRSQNMHILGLQNGLLAATGQPSPAEVPNQPVADVAPSEAEDEPE